MEYEKIHNPFLFPFFRFQFWVIDCCQGSMLCGNP
jgi:hypothetical protein